MTALVSNPTPRLGTRLSCRDSFKAWCLYLEMNSSSPSLLLMSCRRSRLGFTSLKRALNSRSMSSRALRASTSSCVWSACCRARDEGWLQRPVLEGVCPVKFSRCASFEGRVVVLHKMVDGYGDPPFSSAPRASAAQLPWPVVTERRDVF